ncbi:MAG: hypothetical protein IRY99_04120 [Isosphaeraceae bacterium]|nr:hypothetical protein [Isosphaeraceae bacterium]
MSDVDADDCEPGPLDILDSRPGRAPQRFRFPVEIDAQHSIAASDPRVVAPGFIKEASDVFRNLGGPPKDEGERELIDIIIYMFTLHGLGVDNYQPPTEPSIPTGQKYPGNIDIIQEIRDARQVRGPIKI